jgi:hypothetical protein
MNPRREDERATRSSSAELRNYGDSAFNWLFAGKAPSCAMARLARVVIPGLPHHVTPAKRGPKPREN